MAVYFAGDMHLRNDRPERSERLARWVRSLKSNDTLYLVGDVCDFWFVARQRAGNTLNSPGLKALADFKARGGDLTFVAGNHDHSLGSFFQEAVGANFAEGPIDLSAYGLKLHVTHGHKLGGRPAWKTMMESRAFLQSFSALPNPVADLLDDQLNKSNSVKRMKDAAKLLPYYHRYADTLAPKPDLVVFGHIHTPIHDVERSPNLIVLGGWHDRTSYVKLDEDGPRLITEDDPAEPL